jgi:hypothetical protein
MSKALVGEPVALTVYTPFFQQEQFELLLKFYLL